MKDHDDKGKSTGAGAVAGAAVGGVAAGATTGALAGGITGPVGAALGAVVGAVVGAVTGRGAKAAHDSHENSSGGSQLGGTMGDTDSLHTVIGAFDDRSTADRAVDRLLQSGFERNDVHVEHNPSSQAGGQPQAGGGNGSFFPGLFEMDHEEGRTRNAQYAPHAHTYEEAVRRGSAIVVVDTRGEAEADRASALLHELGAIDVDERSQTWRAEGWSPPPVAQNATGQDTRRANGDVMEVVQEELQVGKRTQERGGVRVVQRVSSRPVHELVRLREERAVVDRHPVDRPATSQDLSNFKEGSMEVRESVEQPVVAKKARVVEEVRVGKEVREHEETIEDTVRRKDVDVERFGGNSGSVERERAVASDDPLRKPGGKDKPIV